MTLQPTDDFLRCKAGILVNKAAPAIFRMVSKNAAAVRAVDVSAFPILSPYDYMDFKTTI
jgi:hypothetical protein